MASVLFWNFILQQLKKNWEYVVEWLSLENLLLYSQSTQNTKFTHI